MSHCRSPQIMSSSPACFTVQQVQKSFEPQNNFGRLFSEANNLSQPFVIFRHSFVVLSRRTGNDVDKKVALLWLGNGNTRNIYEISTPWRNVTTTNRDRLATSPPKVVSKSWSCLLTRAQILVFFTDKGPKLASKPRWSKLTRFWPRTYFELKNKCNHRVLNERFEVAKQCSEVAK